MNRHISKRLRVVIVAALALAGNLLSSCNKYELLDGCNVWDKGHPNDWLDPRKHTQIQDHVTGNFTMD